MYFQEISSLINKLESLDRDFPTDENYKKSKKESNLESRAEITESIKNWIFLKGIKYLDKEGLQHVKHWFMRIRVESISIANDFDILMVIKKDLLD